MKDIPELKNAPMLFGLEAQGKIPVIERMLASGASWAARAVLMRDPVAPNGFARSGISVGPLASLCSLSSWGRSQH